MKFFTKESLYNERQTKYFPKTLLAVKASRRPSIDRFSSCRSSTMMRMKFDINIFDTSKRIEKLIFDIEEPEVMMRGRRKR